MLLYNENFRTEMSFSSDFHLDRIEKKLMDQLGGELQYEKENLKNATSTLREKELKSYKDVEDPIVTINVFDNVTGEVVCEKHFEEERE